MCIFSLFAWNSRDLAISDLKRASQPFFWGSLFTRIAMQLQEEGASTERSKSSLWHEALFLPIAGLEQTTPKLPKMKCPRSQTIPHSRGSVESNPLSCSLATYFIPHFFCSEPFSPLQPIAPRVHPAGSPPTFPRAKNP